MYIDSDRIYVLKKEGNYNDIISIYKDTKLITNIKNIYENVREKYMDSFDNKSERLNLSKEIDDARKYKENESKRIEEECRKDSSRCLAEVQITADAKNEEKIEKLRKKKRDFNFRTSKAVLDIFNIELEKILHTEHSFKVYLIECFEYKDNINCQFMQSE